MVKSCDSHVLRQDWRACDFKETDHPGDSILSLSLFLSSFTKCVQTLFFIMDL